MVRHPEGKGGAAALADRLYLGRARNGMHRGRNGSERGRRKPEPHRSYRGSGFEASDYLTCRYSNSVWYRDEKNWYFSNVHWENPRLIDIESSNPFGATIAGKAPERVKLAQQLIREDAGGELSKYPLKGTDKVKAPFIET